MTQYLNDLWAKIKADLKKAHRSWTMVLNFISAVVTGAWLWLLANPGALNEALAFLPQLEGLLSPKVLTAFSLGLNLMAMILRIKTDKPLAAK